MVQTVFGCGRASECATGISVFLLGDFCHTHELQLHAHPRSLSNVCSIPDSCVRPPLVRRTKYYPTILRESYVFRGPDLFQDEALFIYLFTYLLPHTDFRLCFLLVIIEWAKVTVTWWRGGDQEGEHRQLVGTKAIFTFLRGSLNTADQVRSEITNFVDIEDSEQTGS